MQATAMTAHRPSPAFRASALVMSAIVVLVTLGGCASPSDGPSRLESEVISLRNELRSHDHSDYDDSALRRDVAELSDELAELSDEVTELRRDLREAQGLSRMSLGECLRLEQRTGEDLVCSFADP